MEKFYNQLKEKFSENENIKQIFKKESIDMSKSNVEIYREVAFGEVPISHKGLQVNHR